MNRERVINRLAEHLAGGPRHPLGAAGFMIEDEIQAGRKVVQPGVATPFVFPAEDWVYPAVVSLDGDEVRLIAILATEPGSGALGRLLSNIRDAGLRPVIVCPVGPTMPAILKRWKWRCRVVGRGFERVDEWRPAKPGAVPRGRTPASNTPGTKP